MTLTTILTVVGAAGGPAGLIALIMVLPQIRKLQADTAKVEKDADLADIDGATKLSAAALAQMEAALSRAARAEESAHRAEDSSRELRERVTLLERELAIYRMLAQDHVAWDMQQILRLRDLGVEDVPPAPALLPPPEERVTHD